MKTISEISNIHSYDERKISFDNIDRHLSQIDFKKVSSLDELLDYIKIPIAVDDDNRNIYLARAVVKIMYMVRKEQPPLDVAVRMLFQEDVDTFHEICSLLDIPCEIIEGEMKDFTTYRHETYTQKWCAFMSNDSWHLVDLLGVLTATTYIETEGRIVLESEGEVVFDKPEQNLKLSLVIFNDFWFCTNPNVFVHFNFPTDPEWLLLDNSKGPKTLAEFKSMPFTYRVYHTLGLQFLSERSLILHSKNGRCTISLRAHPIVLRSKSFSYTLSFVESTGDISGIKKDDLPLLVRYAPAIDTFSFNIRFPVSGQYVFEVEVIEHDDVISKCRCFDVIIICEEADPNCRKLPIDAGIVGFGYGYTAKEAGLINPSKTTPSVNVNLQADDDMIPSTLTFQIKDDQVDVFDYRSTLEGADDGEGFTETQVNTVTGKLTVVAGVKSEGEYALSITARPKDSNDTPDTVINYILTTNVNEDDEKEEKLIKKRKLDMILESKMEKRVLQKTQLTKKIDGVEKELRELKRLLQIEEEEMNEKASLMPEEREKDNPDARRENDNPDARTDGDDTGIIAASTGEAKLDDTSSLKLFEVGEKSIFAEEGSEMGNDSGPSTDEGSEMGNDSGPSTEEESEMGNDSGPSTDEGSEMGNDSGPSTEEGSEMGNDSGPSTDEGSEMGNDSGHSTEEENEMGNDSGPSTVPEHKNKEKKTKSEKKTKICCLM